MVFHDPPWCSIILHGVPCTGVGQEAKETAKLYSQTRKNPFQKVFWLPVCTMYASTLKFQEIIHNLVDVISRPHERHPLKLCCPTPLVSWSSMVIRCALLCVMVRHAAPCRLPGFCDFFASISSSRAVSFWTEVRGTCKQARLYICVIFVSLCDCGNPDSCDPECDPSSH